MAGSPFFSSVTGTNGGGGFGSLPPGLLLAMMNSGGGASGSGGAAGSLAPQIPSLPNSAPRGATASVNIPQAPAPQQNNMLSSLGGVAGLSKLMGGGGTSDASMGLLGSNGPMLGATGLFGSGGPLFGIDAPLGPSMDQAITNYGSYFGGMSPSEYAAGWSPEAYGLTGAGATGGSALASAGLDTGGYMGTLGGFDALGGSDLASSIGFMAM